MLRTETHAGMCTSCACNVHCACKISRSHFAAAQALYSWFQYELCDVFIELVKPVITRSSSEEGADADKQAFRETLWICLDTGLRCFALPGSVSR